MSRKNTQAATFLGADFLAVAEILLCLTLLLADLANQQVRCIDIEFRQRPGKLERARMVGNQFDRLGARARHEVSEEALGLRALGRMMKPLAGKGLDLVYELLVWARCHAIQNVIAMTNHVCGT